MHKNSLNNIICHLRWLKKLFITHTHPLKTLHDPPNPTPTWPTHPTPAVVFASSSSLSWSIRKLLLYLINNNGTAGILCIINNTVFIAEVTVLCLFLQSKAVASLSRVIVVHLQMLHICHLGFSPLLSLWEWAYCSNVFKHSLQLLWLDIII